MWPHWRRDFGSEGICVESSDPGSIIQSVSLRNSLGKHKTAAPPHFLTWKALGTCLKRLETQIRESHTPISSLVAVSRGGLIPAVFLSNHLKVTDIHIISVRRNLTDERYSEKRPAKVEWISDARSLKEGNILLVDDVVGDGDTIRAAALTLAPRASLIVTAAIACMRRALVKPTFRALTLDAWVVFPWEEFRVGQRGRPSRSQTR
jgi:uncharacterized protein